MEKGRKRSWMEVERLRIISSLAKKMFTVEEGEKEGGLVLKQVERMGARGSKRKHPSGCMFGRGEKEQGASALLNTVAPSKGVRGIKMYTGQRVVPFPSGGRRRAKGWLETPDQQAT